MSGAPNQSIRGQTAPAVWCRFQEPAGPYCGGVGASGAIHWHWLPVQHLEHAHAPKGLGVAVPLRSGPPVYVLSFWFGAFVSVESPTDCSTTLRRCRAVPG
jgi:hypothetical protein